MDGWMDGQIDKKEKNYAQFLLYGDFEKMNICILQWQPLYLITYGIEIN